MLVFFFCYLVIASSFFFIKHQKSVLYAHFLKVKKKIENTQVKQQKFISFFFILLRKIFRFLQVFSFYIIKKKTKTKINKQ